MSLDKTPQGIEFDEWLASINGMHFELYPVKGQHIIPDVVAAKRWLRNERDVVRITVRWRETPYEDEMNGHL